MASFALEHNINCFASRKKYSLNVLPLQKKYRSHFEIIALILEAVKGDGGASFSIMKHASINCAQLKKFLNSLITMGFVEIEMKRGKAMYRATDRGLGFLRQYYVLLGILMNTYPLSGQGQVIYQTSYSRMRRPVDSNTGSSLGYAK
jgi:predicted transcriptional regulator